MGFEDEPLADETSASLFIPLKEDIPNLPGAVILGARRGRVAAVLYGVFGVCMAPVVPIPGLLAFACLCMSGCCCCGARSIRQVLVNSVCISQCAIAAIAFSLLNIFITEAAAGYIGALCGACLYGSGNGGTPSAATRYDMALASIGDFNRGAWEWVSMWDHNKPWPTQVFSLSVFGTPLTCQVFTPGDLCTYVCDPALANAIATDVWGCADETPSCVPFVPLYNCSQLPDGDGFSFPTPFAGFRFYLSLLGALCSIAMILASAVVAHLATKLYKAANVGGSCC